MVVYIVIEHFDGETHIRGVFNELHKATNCVKDLEHETGNYHEIQSYDVE